MDKIGPGVFVIVIAVIVAVAVGISVAVGIFCIVAVDLGGGESLFLWEGMFARGSEKRYCKL